MSSFLLKTEKVQRDTSEISKVDRFLKGKGPAGRLIFALDATGSRRAAWDLAMGLQAEMFREAGSIGGLELMLVYYYGLGKCIQTEWTRDSKRLLQMMQKVQCESGMTQIEKILTRAADETKRHSVSALVFVGDTMEEDPVTLVGKARDLGALNLPAFVFQEGDDPLAGRVFRDIASASKGAYAHFDAGAGKRLSELLKAAAIYAAGGTKALEGRKDEASKLLIAQMKGS